MSTERTGRDDKTGVATGAGAGATAHTPRLGEFEHRSMRPRLTEAGQRRRGEGAVLHPPDQVDRRVAQQAEPPPKPVAVRG